MNHRDNTNYKKASVSREQTSLYQIACLLKKPALESAEQLIKIEMQAGDTATRTVHKVQNSTAVTGLPLTIKLQPGDRDYFG